MNIELINKAKEIVVKSYRNGVFLNYEYNSQLGLMIDRKDMFDGKTLKKEVKQYIKGHLGISVIYIMLTYDNQAGYIGKSMNCLRRFANHEKFYKFDKVIIIKADESCVGSLESFFINYFMNIEGFKMYNEKNEAYPNFFDIFCYAVFGIALISQVSSFEFNDIWEEFEYRKNGRIGSFYMSKITGKYKLPKNSPVSLVDSFSIGGTGKLNQHNLENRKKQINGVTTEDIYFLTPSPLAIMIDGRSSSTITIKNKLTDIFKKMSASVITEINNSIQIYE